jgi:hypothetical protein
MSFRGVHQWLLRYERSTLELFQKSLYSLGARPILEDLDVEKAVSTSLLTYYTAEMTRSPNPLPFGFAKFAGPQNLWATIERARGSHRHVAAQHAQEE